MLSKRHLDHSKLRDAVRPTLLILAATLLIGLGAASPALADHDYRGGPTVTFRSGFPLPFLFPLPVPVPVPVVYRKAYRIDHYDRGHHHVHYRKHHHRDYERGHARHGKRHDHKRYAKHAKRHKRGGRWD